MVGVGADVVDGADVVCAVTAVASSDTKVDTEKRMLGAISKRSSEDCGGWSSELCLDNSAVGIVRRPDI